MIVISLPNIKAKAVIVNGFYYLRWKLYASNSLT
jgi:hypothetical protein